MTKFEFSLGDVDGQPGKWRLALKETARDSELFPTAWKRIAVVCCPQCKGCFGVGGKGSAQIDVTTGRTIGVARCFNCQWGDEMEFVGWDGAEATADHGRRIAEAEQGNVAEKTKHIEDKVRADQAAEFKARVDAELAKRGLARSVKV